LSLAVFDRQAINGKESTNELWSVSAEDPLCRGRTYRGRIFFNWNKNVRAISASEVIGILVAT
jgi:hypothetical protein